MNHLSGCWGLGLTDLHYFDGDPNYVQGANQWLVRNTVINDRLLLNVAILGGQEAPEGYNPFTRPEYDQPDEEGNYQIDLVKAQLAASKLVPLQMPDPEVEPTLDHTKIHFGVNIDPHTAIAAVGLVLNAA